MAKQTFTTGQVLTAAQMTSLQQTAMGGGTASTKTTSYVLVAADAGTVVQMNAAGATTITVNTALFAAGDVVFIQNIGAGVCTVTAGTATVTSAGSLALGQWEGGQLFFNSTSASVFFDYVQTGATSPLTTKGDVWGYSTLDARIPIGTNNQVLTADSAQALGLKWATPASGANASWVLINAGGTNLTAAQQVTVGSISGYERFMVLINNASSASASSSIQCIINTTLATSNYSSTYGIITPAAAYAATILTHVSSFGTDGIACGSMSASATSEISGSVMITGGLGTGNKSYQMQTGASATGSSGQSGVNGGGIFTSTTTISSISLYSATGNFDGGKIYVYGSAT